jgi:outer membrane immunogenic protein
MKRFFALTIVFLGLIGLTQIACAGPERMDKNVVPAPAPCDWSGFYIGLNVGVAGLNTTITDIDDWWSAASHTPEDTNFTGGGQVGYNWQKGAFVFGLEADADYLNTENTQTDNRTESSLKPLWRANVDFQGSLRARAGISVDKALIYATGGVALSHGKSGFLSEEEGFNAYQDEWQPGFVGGVGVEYALNCHWSARMEALYSHYPTTNTTISGDNSYHFDIQNNVYSVRFGINYLFGGGR